MTTYNLFIKVGNSPKSIAVLQYLSSAIKSININTRVNVAINTYTTDQLAIANTIQELTDIGINGLPSLLVPGEPAYHTDTDIINRFKKLLHRTPASQYYDPSEAVDRMQMNTLNAGQDDSSIDENIREDPSKTQSLRGGKASNRIADAISNMESKSGKPSVANRLQKTQSRTGVRGGPSREHPQSAGISITSQQLIDIDPPNEHAPPGKTSGSSLRNRMSGMGSDRPGNLFDDDDDGGIDRILQSISKTAEE